MAIIVVQSDRLFVTEEVQQSLYEMTPKPFELIHVDGGPPAQGRDLRLEQAWPRGFELRHRERCLSPSRARNSGREASASAYQALVETDSIAAPGWPLMGRVRLLARSLEWLAEPFERRVNKWHVARCERG